MRGNKQATQKLSLTHFSVERYGVFHWQALQLSLRQLRQTNMATWMTAAVIGIALALPAVFFVLLQNGGTVAESLEKGTQISLFLSPEDAKSPLANDLLTKIKLRSDVADAKYISPEEGLQDLEKQGDLSDVLAQLPSNPLPPVIEVYPSSTTTTPEQIQQLFNGLKAMPGVESAKLDMLWVKRLHAILDFSKQAVVALGTLLAFAVVLVINHSIRLSTQNRQKEINVLMLVGATRAFIRRPFLYTGMLYGIFGGFLAWLFVEIFIFCLSFPAESIADLYHTHFELSGFTFMGGVSLLLLGLALGWAGSWSAVNSSVSKNYRR